MGNLSIRVMDAPTIAPARTLEAFKLSITRRVYAVDCMTGEKLAYLVRDYKIVG
jgi:hypothetical protein